MDRFSPGIFKSLDIESVYFVQGIIDSRSVTESDEQGMHLLLSVGIDEEHDDTV